MEQHKDSAQQFLPPVVLPEAAYLPPLNVPSSPSAPLVPAVSLKQVAPSESTSSPGDAEAAVSAIWQRGDVILDQYEVRGILGEGGMGQVYQVHHRGWDIDLAVKNPKPAIFARAGGKENFIREAETWIKLGLHPHIVSCFYVRTLGGIPRIFAEYVAGGSLVDWIRTRQLYSDGHKSALERMLDIAIQFAWGLHYAHEQGLVHQDVKPANVMLTQEGIAKVTDFGLAKARALAGESESDTGSGHQSILVSSRGRTPAYCSPEQAAGQDLSRKTDIWSWGVSILEMFVGEVTWMAGEIAREALASHQAQDPMIPPMPADLVKLLVRCFQPRPEDRPTSMLEVATELQAIYARLVDQPYPRQAPRPAEILADSLNNQALSLYDLGKVKEARQKWEQALEVDPQHLETIYNRGVVLWRRGELADDALVQQLQTMLATQNRRWLVRYLLAQVQVERGELDVARKLLEEGVQLAPEETELQTLLGQSQSGSLPAGRCLRTFQGHRGAVRLASQSADGRYVLSVSKDGTLRQWEMSTGRCLRTLKLQELNMSAPKELRDMVSLQVGNYGELVSLSADGRYAVSVQWPGTLRLWEISTGQRLHTFPSQHTHEVNAVSLSADGRYALSASQDRTLRLWEMSTERCLHIFQGHTSGVNAVSLSADGRYALSASQDHTLRLWEVNAGRCLCIFQGHTSGVNVVSLSGDVRYALSGSQDHTLRLWEVNTGRCLRTFQMTDGTQPVNLSADGSFIFLTGPDHTLQFWELPRQEAFCRLHLCKVQAYAGLSQREIQAEAWLGQARQAWKEERFALALNLLQQVRALPGWERTPKSLEAWSALGLFCSRVGLHTGWLAKTFQGHTGGVNAVSLSADGKYALAASQDKTLRLWEVSTGRCLRTFQEQNMGPVLSVSLSRDGKYAFSAAAGIDRKLRLWEVSTGRCLRTFQGHTDGVNAVSLSADGKYALSASQDKTLRLWEVSTGRCLHIFKGHTYGVSAVSLSADGRCALSASWDGTLRLWEVSTGNCLRIFYPSQDVQVPEGVSPVAHADVSLSADGRYALSASWYNHFGNPEGSFLQRYTVSKLDETLRLWDVSTGRCLRTFQKHTIDLSLAGRRVDGRTAGTVSLSADGHYALSASVDKTLRLWDVSTGRCLRTFEGHTNAVNAVGLSADGRYALSASVDETLRFWELDWKLEAHDPVDWDEAARPFLEIFLMQHTPYAGTLPADRTPSGREIQQALTRSGRASWTEEDFQGLIRQLQSAGLGWLRPEGVWRKLEEIVQARQSPPPSPEKKGPPPSPEKSGKRKGWFRW